MDPGGYMVPGSYQEAIWSQVATRRPYRSQEAHMRPYRSQEAHMRLYGSQEAIYEAIWVPGGHMYPPGR